MKENDRVYLIATGQIVCLLMGSFLVGKEFGTQLGFAVLFLGWALMPPAGREL